MKSSEIKAAIENRQAHWQQLSSKHFPNSDDLLTIVVKGHLLLEQHLSALISHHLAQPESLREARLTFHQKTALAKGILIIPFPAEFWDSLQIISQLRNDFAHELEPPKLKAHLATMEALAKRVCKEGRKKYGTVFKTPEGCLKNLLSYWLGYLSATDCVVHIMEKSKKYGPARTQTSKLL